MCHGLRSPGPFLAGFGPVEVIFEEDGDVLFIGKVDEAFDPVGLRLDGVGAGHGSDDDPLYGVGD